MRQSLALLPLAGAEEAGDLGLLAGRGVQGVFARSQLHRHRAGAAEAVQAGRPVVVMNPTHYAVALRYGDDTPAPLCVAKGMDSLALKIRAVAEEAGVPVIEDPPLARALYAAVEIDQTIPRQHFEAVAKVIGFVLSAARKRRAQHR